MEIVVNTKRNLFIRVTRREAIELIHSLSEQIICNSPNSGRLETFANNGTDVSIAVVPE